MNPPNRGVEEEEECLINSNIVLQTAPHPGRSDNRRRSGTNVLGTVFLMVNATLGAGLLNFPQAFDKSGGVISATIVQLAFLIFITAALVILANCSDVTSTITMQNAFAGLCGRASLFICGICVAVYSFGCCLTFLIIIGDQFDRVLATYYGLDFCNHWYFSRAFVTCVSCTLFILPLCFFKRLDVLSYASSVGCLTIIYVVWLVIYEKLQHSNEPPKPVKTWPDNPAEALQIVPIICFAYQSHMTAIPTYACMKDRNIYKFTVCAITSMAICFAVYTIVGIFGYATFGTGKVPSDILQGYVDKSASLTVAIIAIAIKNFTTYPIVLYCGRDSIFELFGWDINVHYLRRIFLTIAWFILTLAIAVLVPDITPVINLMGSLSAAFIFIFPGICLFQSILMKDPELYLNKDRLLICAAIFMTSLGAFVTGFVFVQSIHDLKHPMKPPLVTGFKIGLGASLCP